MCSAVSRLAVYGLHPVALITWAWCALCAMSGCSSAPYDTAAHPALPLLQPNSGDLLAPLKLVSIVASDDPLADSLFAFGDAMGESRVWQAVSDEYGLGKAGAHVKLKGAVMPSGNITQYAIHEYIDAAIHGNQAADADGETLYLLYLPQGTTLIYGTTPNTDCRTVGGYHARWDLRGDGYAVVQRCPVDIGNSQLDDTTIISSHEIIEAATDPTASGWRLPASQAREQWHSDLAGMLSQMGYTEIGDLCEGTRLRDGAFLYQRMWSNRAANGGAVDPCVPAASTFWNDTSAPEPWYPINENGTANILLTGWSAGAVTWPVQVYQRSSNAAANTFVAQLGDAQFDTDGQIIMSNAAPGSLVVSVNTPGGATPPPSGTWATFFLISYIVNQQTFDYLPDADLYHLWPVGVFMP